MSELEKKHVIMFSLPGCMDCGTPRAVFGKKIAYHDIDISQEPDAEAFVRSKNNGAARVPTLFFFTQPVTENSWKQEWDEEPVILVEPNHEQVRDALRAIKLLPPRDAE